MRRVVGGRRGRAGRLRSLAGGHLVVEAAHQVVVVQPAGALRACNTRQSEREGGRRQTSPDQTNWVGSDQVTVCCIGQSDL